MGNIDYHRIGIFVSALAVSILAGWFGQPLIHGNPDAVSVIVNVFSILAGFLVTIMTLLGEPSLYRGRTWRADEVRRSNVYARLVRHKWLFITYLLVLGCVFLSTLIAKQTPDHLALVWIERFYFALAVFAFILSLLLPSRLMKLQMDRFDHTHFNGTSLEQLLPADQFVLVVLIGAQGRAVCCGACVMLPMLDQVAQQHALLAAKRHWR
jgi:hypothetical protein